MEDKVHIIRFEKGQEVTLKHIGILNGSDVYESTFYLYDIEENDKTVFKMTATITSGLTEKEKRWALFHRPLKDAIIKHEDGTTEPLQKTNSDAKNA
jgi:hypothetical protein